MADIELVEVVGRRSRTLSGQTEPETSWIGQTFQKRECTKFIPSQIDRFANRCGCGRLILEHHYLNQTGVKPDEILPLGASASSISNKKETFKCNTSNVRQTATEAPTYADLKWRGFQHTSLFPTDAYGTLEFQGTGEGDKSQYIRLSHDTNPSVVLQLLIDEWKLRPPKMVITVHGGAHNFQLQPKLHRVFCNGLIKAAKTTGAWVMSFGLNTGVGAIVGNALKEHKAKSNGKIFSIGVAPWGVVDHREDLIGPEPIRSYQTMGNPLSKGAVLHTAYSHFLLADNGTAGRYDSELRFRRQLEKRLSHQQLNSCTGGHGQTCSMVCLVLEGGKNTINVVLESLRQTPPIPVIVCDGSGRAADLIAFAHQYADDDGIMIEELRAQLLSLVQETFKCSKEQSNYFFISIMECVKRKDLITVFRMGKSSSQDDIDIAILTATLKARCKSAPDMLGLALSWNRIDIATSQIFVYGQHWPVLSLERAMMEALINERVDFVKILMENGVSMHKFLTVTRLEDLYNAQPPVNLVYLVNDVKKNIPPGYRFNLMDIGQVIEFLMGGAYRSSYTRKRFRLYYSAKMKSEWGLKKQANFRIGVNAFANSTKTENNIDNSAKASNSVVGLKSMSEQQNFPTHFQYPFHELIMWAVLTKRHRMALFMWQQGEEAIAKALVACKLYKTMAKEAAEDDLDVEESEQLRKYSKEFQDLSIVLLEICYRADDDATQHLLTQELKQWSRHTCLSLAVAAKHRDFIAHPCVQLLLNDLWMGGMSERKNSGVKVIVGILLPPSILTLAFKTQEELQLMPQTMEEHLHDASSISSSIKGSNSSSHSSSASSSSSSSKSSSSEIFPKPEVLGKLPEHSKQDPYTLFTTRPRQLTLSKKIYEFYNAPITKFWMYAMAYIVVLLLFTYVVLVKMEDYPSIPELIVISYVITMTMEKIREIVVSEPSGAKKKLKVWVSHFWNLMDMLTILMFYTGLVLRLSQDKEIMQIGRAFYCSNIVLWYTHLLNIISVSKHLGPYVMLMGKMMVDLAAFIILLAVVLTSFGVARQSLLHPNETGSWTLLQDVLMEPYFMLYGEVYAGTIDPCRGSDPTLCVTGSWIAPTLMTMYLLVANILLLNLLIAVFNNTFARVKNYSDTIWKFQRYMAIVEFELRPVLPPPLILFSYLFMFFRSCWKKRKNALSDRGLKLFLDDEDVEKLHDFEEDCVDEYFRSKNKTKNNDSFVKDDRIGKVLNSLEEILEKQNFLTSQYLEIQDRLTIMEDVNRKSNEYGRSRRHTSSMSADPEILCTSPSVLGILPEIPGRMLLRRRPRHESELSSTSDWQTNPYKMRSIGQDQPNQNELLNVDAGIRRTNSTGILSEKKSFEDKANYFNKSDDMELSEDDNKAASCQDIIIRVRSHQNQTTNDNNLNRKLHPTKFSSNFNKKSFDHDESRYFGSVSDEDRISHFGPTLEDKHNVNVNQHETEENISKNTLAIPQIPNSITRNNQSFPKINQFNSSLQGSSKQSDSFQPTYRSITDNIDTSKWHEMYSPSIPLTPFDGFWNGSKTPDFGGSRVLREQSSLSDWDEDDLKEFRTKKSANRHRKKNQHKNHKKTNSGNNMAVSLPSSPKLNQNNNSDVDTSRNLTFPRSNLSEDSPDLPRLKYVCSENTLLLSNHTSPFDFYEY